MSVVSRFLIVIILLASVYSNAQVAEPVYIEAQILNRLNPQLESIVNNHSNYLKSLGLKYSNEDYIIIRFMESSDVNSLRFIDGRLQETIDSIYQTSRIFSEDAIFNNLSYRIFVKTMHKNDPGFQAYSRKPWDSGKLFYYNLNRLNILISSELPIELDTLNKTLVIQICDYSNDNTTFYYNPCITVYHLFRDELTESINPIIDKIYSNPWKYKRIEVLKAKIENIDNQ